MKKPIVYRVFSACIWVALSIPTYYSLPKQQQPLFLVGILGLIGLLLIIPLIFRSKHSAIQPPTSTHRLLNLHSAYRELHEKGLKEYQVYHRLTGYSLILGWIVYIWGQLFGPSLFNHSITISLYFLFSLFLGIKGIEKGNAVDRKLIPIVLKGARIEKKLKGQQISYFSVFTRKKRIFYYFFRFLPLFLIIFPLFKFGIVPIMLSRFEKPLLRCLIEWVPMALTLIFLGRFVFLPYIEFFNKYQKAT